MTSIPSTAPLPARLPERAGPDPRTLTRLRAAAALRIAWQLEISGHRGGPHQEWARTLADHHVGLADAMDAVAANAEVAGHLAVGWARAEASGRQAGPPAEGEGRIVRSGVSPVAESTVDGALCRVSGVCTHLGGILSWNAVERSWDCPLHGSRFDARGVRLEGPAVADLAEA